MTTLLVILPAVLVPTALLYLIGRNVVRVWLEHRAKMLLLAKLERRPELVRSVDELQAMLDDDSSSDSEEGPAKQNLVMTGIFLALFGGVCTALYAVIGRGYWAVGAYWGGVTCVIFGFVLAVLGLLARRFSRISDQPKR
jgi:hypothetical protein